MRIALIGRASEEEAKLAREIPALAVTEEAFGGVGPSRYTGRSFVQFRRRISKSVGRFTTDTFRTGSESFLGIGAEEWKEAKSIKGSTEEEENYGSGRGCKRRREGKKTKAGGIVIIM